VELEAAVTLELVAAPILEQMELTVLEEEAAVQVQTGRIPTLSLELEVQALYFFVCLLLIIRLLFLVTKHQS
jgi:hypothetical protein